MIEVEGHVDQSLYQVILEFCLINGSYMQVVT
jgi:hypothetical protein